MALSRCTPTATKSERRAEAEEAAEVLGGDAVFLDIGDYPMRPTDDHLYQLVDPRTLNAEDVVLDSLQVTFPGINWKELADYYAPRLIRHAKRQSEEMLSVAETLEELGVEPITVLASAKRLGWLGDLGLESELDELPQNYGRFLDILIRQEQEQ